MASIFLAVGHGISTNGQWDCGCTDGPYTEADLMKPIVGVAVDILRHYGVDVHTDYPENDMNISACVTYANSAGVDAYVSLHCDWNQAPSGTYPIAHPNSGSGASLANTLNASIMLRMGMKTRGLLLRDDWEVTDTNMPACIFETGSIRVDIDKLLNYEAYGQAVAFGILDYFGIQYNGNTPTPPTPQPPTPSNKYGFTSVYNGNYYLAYGDGPDSNIGQMQRDANFCGYRDENGNKLDVDNLFGSNCAYVTQCIERFHNLEVDAGYFGHDCDIALMCEAAGIQEALNKHGYNLTVDGVVGDATEAALTDFQAKNGLEVDACCGDATRAALGI